MAMLNSTECMLYMYSTFDNKTYKYMYLYRYKCLTVTNCN